VDIQRHPVFEQIDNLSDSLNQPSLSPSLRTSLDIKLQNYQILMDRIEISRRAPAQKLPLTQNDIDLLQSSNGSWAARFIKPPYDNPDR